MAQYWPYTLDEGVQAAQAAQAALAQAEKYARYSNLMSASQPFVVDEILASYRFDDHHCVLDVGGGQGTFMSRLALHAKHLQVKLFDLPEVAALARANFARQGLEMLLCRVGRLEAQLGGDLGTGGRCASALNRFVHQVENLLLTRGQLGAVLRIRVHHES